MRRLHLEALEDRRMLSFGLASELDDIGFSGEAGILTASPAAPDLLTLSDSGVSGADNLTNLDNSQPENSLQFAVGDTIAGATVALYADGIAIASAVANGPTTTLTTKGSFDLADGPHTITARQTAPGEEESADSAALELTIDTLAPILNPARLGGYKLGWTAQVAVSGTRAYVVDHTAGLAILDVTNPAAPTQLGALDTSGTALAIAVRGTLAYVAEDDAGLAIIDVTNPAVPVQLGVFDTSGKALGVDVVGTLAYVADYDAGLVIIDVTNPALPVRVGGYDTSGSVRDIAVSGTLAFLADDDAGLTIIDVANPAAPVWLGTLDTSGYAADVAVSGTRAYVADGAAGLAIIDVANPAAPVRLGGYDTDGFAWDVAVCGTLAYVLDHDELAIIDVSDPAALVRLGGYDTPGSPGGVTISGPLAYIADGNAGLQILDVRPLGSPPAPDLQAASDTGISGSDDITADNTPTFDLGVPVGFYSRIYRDGGQISGDWETGATYTTAVQANGTYCYTVATVDAAGNLSPLSAALPVTIDASIPSAPDLLAVFDSGVSSIDNVTNVDNSQPDQSLQFAVGDTIAGATVTLYADGIAIASAVANGPTTTLTTNGSFDLADGPHTITARQTAPGEKESTDSAALNLTVDTRVPFLNPVSLGTCSTGEMASRVVLAGTLAYVADAHRGLVIVDVANPAEPSRLGGYFLIGGANDVAVSGTRAYVTNWARGLQILDVSNPAAPTWLGEYRPAGAVYGICVVGTLAYVTDWYGLSIVDVSNPAAPVRLSELDTSIGAVDVTVSGPLAYVVTTSTGLEIIDVTNPAAPVRLGGYDTPGSARDVAVSGTRAYVLDSDVGLVIVDVANPAAPVRLGALDVGETAVGVAVSGPLAYVAGHKAGLVIVDATDPAAPVRLSSYNVNAEDVAVAETRAYVVDGFTRLSVIDFGPSPDLQPASDTGTSNTDNVTGDNTPTFNIDVPVGAWFRIYRDGVQISGDYETGASYTMAVQADGSYRYTIVAVDAAGNVSSPSQASSVTVDTLIPSAPDLLAVCDTGVSNADRLTRLDNSQPDKSLQFTVGNTIAGATVVLYADGVAIGSTAATGATTTVTTNGSFALADGPHAITARHILPDGLEWKDSAALTLTIDTSPAASPLAPDLQPASDTGASNTDNITADDTPTFSISVPAGVYFRVYRDGDQISGDYSSGAAYTAPLQANGTYRYTITSVDAAGNVSAHSPPLLVTVDTSIPSIPDLLAVSDSGVSNSDNLTNLDNSQPEKSLQFAVGNTIAGATVTLYADGIAIASAVANGPTTTVTTSGSFDLVDGPHAITARQTLPGQSQSTDSAALNVTLDATLPASPSAPDLLAGSDTGISSTDNITGDNTPIFRVVIPSGAYFRLYRDGVLMSGEYASGNTYMTAAQADGTYGFTVAVVDAAGNVSAQSPPLLVTVDALIPSAPDLLAVSDSGFSSIDDVTNLDNSQPEKSLQFAVRNTRAGATVIIYTDGVAIGSAAALGATTTVTTDGGRDLADGAHAITARQSLPGEPEGRESSLWTVTIDTVAPASPLAPDLLASTDTGISDSDNITGVNTLSFSFSVPSGSYSRVYREGVQISGDYGTGGTYTTPIQPDGTYGYAVASVDRVGNVSALSGSLAVTVDTSIPAVPNLLAAFDTGVSGTDKLTNLDNSQPGRTLQFTIGNAVAGAIVTLYADGTAIGSAVAAAATTTVTTNGSFDLADGMRTITARQTVPGRAESTDSAAIKVTIDTISPAAPLPLDLQPGSDTGLSSTDNITGDSTPTFSIPALAAPYFRIYRDGVQISGDYGTGGAYTASTQVDGTYGYTIVGVDAAGNLSDPSATLSVTVDATIPMAPDLLAICDTGISNTDNRTNLDNSQPDKQLQFTVGNTIAGATVTIYANGIAIGSAVAPGATTSVATNGSRDLPDGAYAITARQTLHGQPESRASAGLTVTIDTFPAGLLNPVPLGALGTGGAAYGVDLVGALAYVADSNAGLAIIDVTNPSAPVRLGGYDTRGSAQGVTVHGNLAYVADGSAGLQIIDVTDPVAPVWMGEYDTTGTAYAVAISGTLAYVADHTAGLVIVDVCNPVAPVRLGGYDTDGFARGVAVSGTRAYVADDIFGLAIIDVTDPTAPTRLGGYRTPSFARGVTVSGTLAYVGDWSAGLQIIDVTNPGAPVRLGQIDTGIVGRAEGVTVFGTLAYLADEAGGVSIIDVTNPAAPVRLGTFDSSGRAHAVAVSGTLAYVADGAAGLQLFDLGVPISPSSPNLQAASDTGASNTDDITGDTTPTFDLPALGGPYFRVYRDGVQISGDYSSGVIYTTPVQAEGSYRYTVAAVDPAGNVSSQSPPLLVTIDCTPPAVVQATINDGDPQRSTITHLAFRFSEDVSASLDDGDLKLANSISGDAADLSAATLRYDPVTYTATWDSAGVVLDDGYYTAKLLSAGVTDALGSPLVGGDYTFQFFHLMGDTDGNASVDIFDVAKLQVNYGQTGGMDPADGDFDGNGTVDIFDVALLQTQYGRTLDPPAPAPAPLPVAETMDWVAIEPLLSAKPEVGDDLAEAMALAKLSKPTRQTPPSPSAMGAAHGSASSSARDGHPRRHGAHAPAKPAGRLAVRHALEDPSWEAAVDRLFAAEESPSTS